MAIHESGENFLESILVLGAGQKDVHSVEVARRLGVSKPTVTKGVKILMQEGYVVMDGVHLRLTPRGGCGEERIGRGAARLPFRRAGMFFA